MCKNCANQLILPKVCIFKEKRRMYLRDQLVQLLKVCPLCRKKKITLDNVIIFYTEAPSVENNRFVEAV